MNEIWVRVAVVVGVLAVAGSIVAIQRRRRRSPERDIAAPRLEPGLYLFSSTACSTCDAARQELVAAVGVAGFSEYVWEEDPGAFSELGIDAVPSVLVMGEGGQGRLYPGRADKALAGR